MSAQVADRKAEISGSGSEKPLKNDAFTMLVSANENDGAKLKLDDEELVNDSHSCSHKLALHLTLAFTDRQRVHHVVCWPW